MPAFPLNLTLEDWARVCALQQRRWMRRACHLDLGTLALVIIASVPNPISWSSLVSLVTALGYRWLSGLAKRCAADWRTVGESVTRAMLDPEHAEHYMDAIDEVELRLI